MKLIKNALFLLLLASITACAPPPPEEFGTLRGHVSIGPLVPVMREGEPEPTPAPEVYSARQIVIYSADGKTEVARANIDYQGNYQINLPTGQYVIDINHLGIDSAAGLPTTIQIEHQMVTTLDIDIDTGIR
ncbi:MAG: hypothetical protein FVQ83_05595 [Chloroflexi bacterium]|nr:hypothetical protein [Chloroflexota bacterium]